MDYLQLLNDHMLVALSGASMFIAVTGLGWQRHGWVSFGVVVNATIGTFLAGYHFAGSTFSQLLTHEWLSKASTLVMYLYGTVIGLYAAIAYLFLVATWFAIFGR